MPISLLESEGHRARNRCVRCSAGTVDQPPLTHVVIPSRLLLIRRTCISRQRIWKTDRSPMTMYASTVGQHARPVAGKRWSCFASRHRLVREKKGAPQSFPKTWAVAAVTEGVQMLHSTPHIFTSILIYLYAQIGAYSTSQHVIIYSY